MRKDSRGRFFQRHREADLGDGLTYREAYSSDAAQAVVDHLVNTRGLRLDRESVPEPGKIVFVCRKEAVSRQHSAVSQEITVGSG